MVGVGVVRNEDGSLEVMTRRAPSEPPNKTDIRRYVGYPRYGAVVGQMPPPYQAGTVEAATTWLQEYAADREQWERQRGETAKAYAAFMVYRDLGPFERSVAATARVIVKGKTNCLRWSRLWLWEERAGLWDDRRQRSMDAARTDAQRDAIRIHERASRALLQQSARVIDAQQRATDVDPRALQSVSIAMDKAIYHHRLALGLPTDLNRQDVALKEQLKQMLNLYDGVKAVIEEMLCPDCRTKVAARLRELGEKQRRIRDANL